MDPVLMFIVALSLPLLFALLLLGPLYAGLCASLYMVHGDKILPYLYDPPYMIDMFDLLYRHWRTYHEQLGWMDFVLPAFGPSVMGALLGLYWCSLFVRYIKNIWHI